MLESIATKIKFQKYPAYKDSGVEWLGEIPEGWEVIRIKNLFKEINERSTDGSEDLLSVSQYTGVTNKTERLEEGGMLSNASSLDGYKKVSKGDLVSNIMLAWNGSLGFSPFDGITSPAYSIYRIKTNDLSTFFHYLFRTSLYKSEFKRNSSGVIESRLRLYTDDFFNIKSILPPLPEQTAIATFLDDKTEKIDRAIAQKEQLIALLKERKQIMIQDLVTGKKVWSEKQNAWVKPEKVKDSGVECLPAGQAGIGEIPEDWEVKRLKAICKTFGRIGFRGYSTSDLVDEGEGAITISPSNIQGDFMSFEKCTYLSWSKFHESPEIKIFKNDVLIVKTGSTYGKVGFASNLESEATINPQLLVFKDVAIDKEYFYEVLNSSQIQVQINKEVIGSTIPTISENKILNMKAALPQKSEISKIVERIREVKSKFNDAISLQQGQIAQLKEYKSVLIDGAVTGKIKVS